MDATLTVLLFSSIAAAAAALGVTPLIGQETIPAKRIGWASAIAAGMMLGAAYTLTEKGMAVPALPAAAGALTGVLFVFWTHSISRPPEIDHGKIDTRDAALGYKVLLTDTLHSVSEGVAIGVAMAVDLPFGIFVAIAIAVHNIPEATALSAVMRARGVSLAQASGLAVVSNIGQVLFAVVTFAVISAAPATLPWVLGFSVGALVNLVMVELLPDSYRGAGSTSIALAASVAMSVVVLFEGLLS